MAASCPTRPCRDIAARHWLLRPVQEAEASLGTNRVSVGDTFTVTLRVRNLTVTPHTLGLPIGFRFTGDARCSWSAPPRRRTCGLFPPSAVSKKRHNLILDTGHANTISNLRRQLRTMIETKRAPAWMADYVLFTDDPDEVVSFYRKKLQVL